MHSPPCLACGHAGSALFSLAKDLEYFTVPETFAYRECVACDSLFIDPVPADRLSIIYPKNYYSFAVEDSGVLMKVKTYLDSRLFRWILKKLHGDRLNVLDVGGGDGWLLDVLAKADHRISVRQIVDIDGAAGARALKKGHTYFQGRIEEFQTETRFDLILMLNLIEHVSDPGRILKAARCMLKPGGFLLLKTPNHDTLDARIFRNRNWAGYHCPRHWVLFSMNSLHKLVSALGYQVEMKRYTQGSPFWAYSLLHWLHERGWIRISARRPAARHPLAPFLILIFAAFDFLRVPFAKTSQMFFLLRNG